MFENDRSIKDESSWVDDAPAGGIVLLDHHNARCRSFFFWAAFDSISRLNCLSLSDFITILLKYFFFVLVNVEQESCVCVHYVRSEFT